MTSFPHTWQDNYAIFKVLFQRDLKVLKTKILGELIDCIILSSIQVTTFGYFFPLMGLPSEMIAPLYLSMSIVNIGFFQGFAFSTIILEMLPDQGPSMIQYHLTLPISRSWLFAEYILYFMLETTILTLPLVGFGIILVPGMLATIQGSWLAFCLVYILSLLFMGLLFLMLPLWYDYDWFRQNLWARRLTWMLNISTMFFTLETLKKISPFFAKIVLISPLTYIAEGLRVSLLGGNTYLPLPICLAGICTAIIITSLLLKTAIIRRLDPV